MCVVDDRVLPHQCQILCIPTYAFKIEPSVDYAMLQQLSVKLNENVINHGTTQNYCKL